jgi:hypothetical protein
VTLDFLKVGDIFKELPQTQDPTAFRIAQDIRTYRNILIHSLPLKLMIDGITYLPKPKQQFLNKYRDGRWSSGRKSINRDHYAPAAEILDQLASELVSCTNTLWASLLECMAKIPPEYDETVFASAIDVLSSAMIGRASGVDYTDEDQENIPPTIFKPPTLPSGRWNLPSSVQDANDDPLL